jgi:hypothetical protein
MFDFTDLLDRFTWLKVCGQKRSLLLSQKSYQEFLIIFDTVITTETCDQVMKVMTTAVMATTVVQHTSVIWLWGHYELEKLLQELGCKATSSNETLQQQAEIFEQLGTLLEALLIYAVVGSTMGLKTVVSL